VLLVYGPNWAYPPQAPGTIPKMLIVLSMRQTWILQDPTMVHYSIAKGTRAIIVRNYFIYFNNSNIPVLVHAFYI